MIRDWHAGLSEFKFRVNSRSGLCMAGVLTVALFFAGCSSSKFYGKMKADLKNESAKQVIESIIKLPPSEVRIDSIVFSSGERTVYDTVTVRVYNVTVDSTDFTLEYAPQKTMHDHVEPPKVTVTKKITANPPLESICAVDLGGDGKPDTVYFNFIVGTRLVNSNRWIPYTPGYSYDDREYGRIQEEGNPFLEKWYRDTMLKPILNGLQKK